MTGGPLVAASTDTDIATLPTDTGADKDTDAGTETVRERKVSVRTGRRLVLVAKEDEEEGPTDLLTDRPADRSTKGLLLAHRTASWRTLAEARRPRGVVACSSVVAGTEGRDSAAVVVAAVVIGCTGGWLIWHTSTTATSLGWRRTEQSLRHVQDHHIWYFCCFVTLGQAADNVRWFLPPQ